MPTAPSSALVHRSASAGVALAVLFLLTAAPAAAVQRPSVDGPPPAAEPKDSGPVTMEGPCRTTAAAPLNTSRESRSIEASVRAAWKKGQGEGQTVAVIDTGVNSGPRLPRVRGAGDYVFGKSGTEDCDAHGTLVAGVIAGTDAGPGMTGIAPAAEIVSIRQSSGVFRSQTSRNDQIQIGAGVGTISTLARAVRAAADSGAKVLNISEVACVPAGTALADTALGAAIRYAAVDRDVVIVAAAGNVGSGGCTAQNPERADPTIINDDGWASVQTIATPAWYDDLVLSVGAVDQFGAPADFSLRGPWVDIAAPGTDVVSVGADGAGISDRIVAADGSQHPISGTSFAAPFVAGVAALVRQAYPKLSAAQVISRIHDTALPAAGGRDFAVGRGLVDPAAAVSSIDPATPPAPQELPVASPQPAPPSAGLGDAITRVASVIAVGGLAALAVVIRRRLVPRSHRG